MTVVVLYRINPAKRMHRHYRMDVEPDLFGEWCLMKAGGRIGGGGQIRIVPFRTPQEAESGAPPAAQN